MMKLTFEPDQDEPGRLVQIATPSVEGAYAEIRNDGAAVVLGVDDDGTGYVGCETGHMDIGPADQEGFDEFLVRSCSTLAPKEIGPSLGTPALTWAAVWTAEGDLVAELRALRERVAALETPR